MEEYRKLCEEYVRLRDNYQYLFCDDNPLYQFIRVLLDYVKEDKGISEEEDERLWDEIVIGNSKKAE